MSIGSIYNKLYPSLIPPVSSGGVTYATWSAANTSTHIGISGSNLTVTGVSGTNGIAFTNLFVANGNKRYWEVTSNSNYAGTLRVGVGNSLAVTLNANLGAVSSQWALESLSNPGGQVVNNGVSFSNGYASHTFNTGDIIGIALDLVGNTIQFYKNNVPCGTSVSVTGGDNYYAAASMGLGLGFTANFGASPFIYPVPSGFTGGIY